MNRLANGSRRRPTAPSEGPGSPKRTYEAPSIIHTEKLTARAFVCHKADSQCALQSGGGSIQS